MKNTQINKGSSLKIMSDPVEAKERLLYAIRATERLFRYRDTLDELEHSVGTEKHFIDRTRRAENDTRVLLKCAIDSLNEVRDSRDIEDMAQITAKISGNGEALDFSTMINGAKKVLRENMPEISLSFLDECEAILKQYKLNARFDGDIIHTQVKMPDGKERKFTFSSKVHPGDSGRVNAAEFFGTVGATTTLANHTQKFDLKPTNRVDYYNQTIGAFAYARDTMALNTKVVEYFGRPNLKASFFGLSIFVILLIVAIAVVIVAGITIKILCATGFMNGKDCDWGNYLIFGGLVAAIIVSCSIEPVSCALVLAAVPVAEIGQNPFPG